MSKDFLFGAHSVREWLEADPNRIESLLAVPNPNPRVVELIRKARKAGIQVEEVSTQKLKQMARPRNPQGVAARVRPYPYASIDDVLAMSEVGTEPVILAVDGVTDPGNLGAIIRSAAFFGVRAVVLPRDRSATITPVVERAAAGGVAQIAICQENSLIKGLERLQSEGFRIVGSIPGPHSELSQSDLRAPLVVVVGSEGRGIRPSVRRLCDEKIALPGQRLQSLNVSAFTSVILYEVFRQSRVLA